MLAFKINKTAFIIKVCYWQKMCALNNLTIENTKSQDEMPTHMAEFFQYSNIRIV